MELADLGNPFDTTAPPAGLEALVDRAEAASNFLKALGHDGRLTILCHLLRAPHSVTQLENLLSSRQAVVSQQLARLRLEGLVSARREGQTIIYSLLDPKVAEMIRLLCSLYGDPAQDRTQG
ncbi:metalloregulator ArsR/SmtB family transcription factor [Rhodobacter sp. Har01]|uniref:ArsR/SmtB family transcription factor n=1 Tax=Rhodobacter sp. Har01 TaxID=2883999 RepID=UPI001D07ECAA|nr:metalloregulator ArsR/SmtB family transcription factor [Rhodobacter sp. Har01]MCB6179299.1 metalloregulator ArsR/SmtB family transcription factor [Rhodobacter sp. Har01]